MLSLRDLAKKSKVSVSTVSRALRNDPIVKEDTRQRIQQIAAQYDYRPNRLAEGIFTGRMRLIGIIVVDASRDHMARLCSQIADDVADRGWGTLLLNSHNDPKREEQCLHTAVGLRVGGVIISSVNFQANEQHFWELRKHNIPFVITTEYSPSVAVPHLHGNDMEMGMKVVAYLVGLGHRRIATIAGQESTLDSSLRYKGYRNGLKAAGIEFNPNWLETTDWSFEAGVAATKKILKSDPKVTAVFAATDTLAAGVYSAAKELGLRIPDDLSVVGVGDAVFSKYIEPALTTIQQNEKVFASNAVEVLFQMMELQPEQPLPMSLLETVVPGELIIRKSTGPARENASK